MSFPPIFLLIQQLPDGGPVYAETNTDVWIVEPFNALSSLAYLVPAIFWALRLKGKFKQFSFLFTCLPFLLLGGIGSALYHAFRSSAFLLYMDVLPIAILTFMVSIYFWIKILPKLWHIVFILIPFILVRYIIYSILSSGAFRGKVIEGQMIINISYFISGLMIFLPAILILIKSKFHDGLFIVISCVLFMVGLLFREMDLWGLLIFPLGTHWLWHIATAAGSWFLGEYLYRYRKREIEKESLT